MAAQRRGSDLGQSYLDLLSNGLGAVVILFMILVATLAPTRYTSLRSKRESSLGRVDTERSFGTDRWQDVGKRYVVQLVVMSDKAGLVPRIEDSSPEPASTRVFEGVDPQPGRRHWLIIRERGKGRPWEIALEGLEGEQGSVDVYVYGTLDSHPVVNDRAEVAAGDSHVVRFQDSEKGSVYAQVF